MQHEGIQCLLESKLVLRNGKFSSIQQQVFFEIQMDSGRIFTELLGDSVNILARFSATIFTWISKNNCTIRVK